METRGAPADTSAEATTPSAVSQATPRVVPHWAVVAAIALIYVLTRYPDVGGRINMGDSAKFQFLARTLGIGHSPGNPLYLMASALWVRTPLPLADATKVTLLSSVFGLLTVALVGRAAMPKLGAPRGRKGEGGDRD